MLRQIIAGLAWLGFAGAFLAIGAASLGVYCSFIERLTHLRFYWLGALLVLMTGWAAQRRIIPALAAAGLFFMGLPGIIAYYRTPAAPGLGNGISIPLTAITWNVHSSNTEQARAEEWLRNCQADILLLTEVNPAWARELKAVSLRWPHRILEVRKGAAGMWLLSRYPLSVPAPEGIAADREKPWIDCIATTSAGPVRILGFHPRTPRGGQRFTDRNGQLMHIGDQAAAARTPVIVLGDLNCTPFSPWFDRMLKAGGLRDSSLGFGLTSTWQSYFWQLPIDHILVSSGIGVRSRRVEADRLGSDHHPVIAELVIPGG